jgi:hypothetical protein
VHVLDRYARLDSCNSRALIWSLLCPMQRCAQYQSRKTLAVACFMSKRVLSPRVSLISNHAVKPGTKITRFRGTLAQPIHLFLVTNSMCPRKRVEQRLAAKSLLPDCSIVAGWVLICNSPFIYYVAPSYPPTQLKSIAAIPTRVCHSIKLSSILTFLIIYIS